MNQTQKPDFIRREADGSDIYLLDHFVNAERRTTKNARPAQSVETTDLTTLENSEDIEADPGGLVRQKWRFISARQAWPTTAYGQPQLVDYGHDGGVALSQAVQLINQSNPDLTWNHSIDAKDVAGYITDATWEQSTDIEPGITGYVVVDPEFDAKAARGISRGIIRSGSIGISAEMVKSHPDMDLEEFLGMQGTDVDGDVVRWKLKSVVDVRHMAMLATGTGADPNAGLRFRSSIQNSEGKQMIETTDVRPDDSLLARVCGLLKVDESTLDNAELVESKISERIGKLQGKAEKYTVLAQSISALESQVIAENESGLTVQEIVERLPHRLSYAAHGEKYLEDKRSQCLRWFDAAKVQPDRDLSDNAKRLRQRIIDSDDIDFVCELLEEYEAQAQDKFALNRSSAIDEIPEPKIQKTPMGAKEQKIRDGANRLFGGTK